MTTTSECLTSSNYFPNWSGGVQSLMNSTVDLTTATLLRVVVMVVVIDGEVRGKMQFVSQSVHLSLRFCEIISNHWFSAQERSF